MDTTSMGHNTHMSMKDNYVFYDKDAHHRRAWYQGKVLLCRSLDYIAVNTQSVWLT